MVYIFEYTQITPLLQAELANWHIQLGCKFQEHPYHRLPHHHRLIYGLLLHFGRSIIIAMGLPQAVHLPEHFYQRHSYSPHRLLLQIQFLRCRLHQLRDHRVGFQASLL